MKMMKVMAACAAAAVMTFGFAACGSSAQAETSGTIAVTEAQKETAESTTAAEPETKQETKPAAETASPESKEGDKKARPLPQQHIRIPLSRISLLQAPRRVWRNGSQPLPAVISMRSWLPSPIQRMISITATGAAVPPQSRMIKMPARRSEAPIFPLKAIRPFIWAFRSGGVKSRASWIPLWKNTALKGSL